MHTPRSDNHFCCRSHLNQVAPHQLLVTDMRLRSKLFYVFLAVLLVAASIVEASKKRKRDEGGKKSKKQKLVPSTIPIDTLGSDGGVPIQGNFGSGLGSERTSEENASVGEASSTVEGGRFDIVSVAAFGSGTERDDTLGKEFRKAVDGRNFGWLNANWERLWDRRDLLDDVITKGVDVTVWLIQSENIQNGVCLPHSLIKEKRE